MSAIPHSERRRFVGASESAALLGVSPFTTAYTLWHEKAGLIEPDNLDDDERVQAGRFLEPAIARWAEQKWGWPLKYVPDYWQHPTVAGMGASPDYSDGNGAPVEIKTADWLVFRDEWGAEGDTITDAPTHYLVQVQHQLACKPDAPHGWLVVCVAGNRLYRMKIDRHPGVIARLEQVITDFWASIEAGTPPAPDFGSDAATIGKLHSRGNGEFLDLSSHNRLPEICAEYRDGKEQEKAGKKRADAALAEIRHLIGEASGAIGPDGWTIKATDIAPSEVPATTRKGYRRWTIKQKEVTA